MIWQNKEEVKIDLLIITVNYFFSLPSQNINSIRNSLNTQNSNTINISRPLSKLISTVNYSRKRNIEELKIEAPSNGK